MKHILYALLTMLGLQIQAQNPKVISTIQKLAKGKGIDKKTLINYFDTANEDDIIDYHIWFNEIQ